MEQIFYRAFLLLGGILHPFDSWLLLRGLRTLPVRMQQHESDALRVAEFLRNARGSRGGASSSVHGSLTGSHRILGPVQLRVERCAASPKCPAFIDALKRFRIGVSWGGVESLVISPNRGKNLHWLDAQRMPHGLIRVSIGLEGADALIEDLAAAFA